MVEKKSQIPKEISEDNTKFIFVEVYQNKKDANKKALAYGNLGFKTRVRSYKDGIKIVYATFRSTAKKKVGRRPAFPKTLRFDKETYSYDKHNKKRAVMLNAADEARKQGMKVRICFFRVDNVSYYSLYVKKGRKREYNK